MLLFWTTLELIYTIILIFIYKIKSKRKKVAKKEFIIVWAFVTLLFFGFPLWVRHPIIMICFFECFFVLFFVHMIKIRPSKRTPLLILWFIQTITVVVYLVFFFSRS